LIVPIEERRKCGATFIPVCVISIIATGNQHFLS